LANAHRPSNDKIDQVGDILESYARRGVFRGFSRGPVENGTARFRMLWHRDRYFDLTLDTAKSEIRIATVLPEVPARSPMYGAFKEFIRSRNSEELLPHRRIDERKVTVQCGNRQGNVSMVVKVLDGDVDYATRKMIQLVHEVYMVFLVDGPYLEYMVDAFQLDPDRI
jgi:hypothetical protein